jgi:hypothetical protein
MTSSSRSANLEQLLDSGDRACARGDRTELAEVARRLCAGPASPLRGQLVEIEQLTASDPAEAIERWFTVSRCLRDWIASGYAHHG